YWFFPWKRRHFVNQPSLFPAFWFTIWFTGGRAQEAALSGGLQVAKKLLMTWDADTRRWLKKYKGRMYAVSCRQLEAPPTKEASGSAANAWWLRKQAEIDQKASQPTPAEQMRAAVNVLALVEEFNATDRQTKMRIAEAVLGPGKIKEM